MSRFDPHHIRISSDEIAGNGGRGRIFLLPGSDWRARTIAERFQGVTFHPSPRQINAFLGTLPGPDGPIDVGAISTGMGCPSLGIVVTELIQGGARRFLRVGSAGSVQPHTIRAGSLVLATCAVRDEATSDAYVPREVPAVAHPHWLAALERAAVRLGLDDRTYAGPVHTKDSLYGREFATGPLAERNRAYMEMLEASGVVATEMESSHLFVLAACHGGPPVPLARRAGSLDQVKAGTVLAIIGDDRPFAPREVAAECEERAVDLACGAVEDLVRLEGAGV